MIEQKDMEDLHYLNQVLGDASQTQIWHNRDLTDQNNTILAPKRTTKAIFRIEATEGIVLQMEYELNHLVKYPPQELLAQVEQVEFLVVQTKSQ